MKCSLPYPILPRYPFPVNSTSYKNVLLLLSEVTSQFFFPAIYQFIAHIKRKKKSLWKKAICAGDKSEGSAVILLDCHPSSFEHSNGKLNLATGCTNESLKVQLSY